MSRRVEKTVAARSVRSVRQRFTVPFEYPVVFGRGFFDPACPVLADAVARGASEVRRVQVFIDSGVAAACPGIEARLKAYARRWSARMTLAGPCVQVPGGEAAKTSSSCVTDAMRRMADAHLCRHSVVLAIGGGSALDVVGLAASLVHRGVRLVRMPTTVLAQADSGVGVKNGVDAYGMKNFAGTFAPPFAVLVDFDFLPTVPWSYWIGGVSEAFKVAMIRDRAMFDRLCAVAPRLRERDERAMVAVVEQTARLHLEHIRTGGDPFEFGSSRPLDFGHWSAHRLEIVSGYAIGHGQAVAVGIALDTCYACRKRLITAAERDAALRAMSACGLPVWSDELARRDREGRLVVLKGLEDFREHLGGRLTVTLPAPIGRGLEVHAMDARLVEACVGELERRHARGPGA
jgi:3-dehydroquinate synthase